ncbi:MAG: hypothetical protein EB828_02055 [Nitrosopumilus sp. D6]|nr:MAG: hypothetical protein EB828_02055 [Nitrosopumilus sp. D6]
MVDLFDDKDIVLRLVQKATDTMGGMPGKKALQKSIYFFTRSHGRFYYKWADYGPFSGEVQHIVADFMYMDKIRINDIHTQKPEAVIKNMKYNKGNFPDFRDFPPKFDKTLDSIILFIKDKKPRELELLASVHYLADMQMRFEGRYDAEFVYKRLTALKPDAGFTKKDVTDSFKVLKDNNFPVQDENSI